MSISRKAGVTAGGVLGSVLVSCAVFVVGVTAGPARAEQPATTLATLLDKAAIQDMLVDYYGHLGGGGGSFGAYYVSDGILDVNGIIAQGQQPIEELYKKIAAGSPPHKGAFRMLLTNSEVVVNGTTATADMIWTGINSDTPESIPQFVEQGREHDELVKQGGHWLFKHRYISSDAGLQPMFEKTYKKR